jgi:hypothetical protein
MGQLDRLLNAIDTDLDLVVLVGERCASQVNRAGTGYDRIGIIPFTAGSELRLVKAGRLLRRIGLDLNDVVDAIVRGNRGDPRRRRILRRIWNLNGVKAARAS